MEKFKLLTCYYTLITVPTASPTNLTLIDVTATSATVGWYPPDPSSWNGLLTHYIINYQLIRSREETMGSSTNPQLSFVIPSFGQPLVNELDPTRIDSSLLMERARVNGLEEYYVYQFSVYYETTVGRSPSSTSLLLETLPAGSSHTIYTINKYGMCQFVYVMKVSL